MARFTRRGGRAGGSRTGALHPVPPPQAGTPAPGRHSAADPDPLRQHDLARAGARLPRGRGDGASHPPHDPVERAGHGPARQHAVRRHRWSSLHLRVGRQPVRGWLQPLLPWLGRRSGRPRLLPGSCRARHLCPRLPRRPPVGRPARPLPSGGADPGRPPVLPAPADDARVLAVPHRLHGARSAERHLPGPVQSLPGGPRDRRHVTVAGLELRGRRRDGRARVPGRVEPRRPGGPRQPDLRRELQPPAPRRPGPRQRQDHPGAGVGLPRRRLARDQGHLGPRVGRPARARHRWRAAQQDDRDAGRGLPDPVHRRWRVRA